MNQTIAPMLPHDEALKDELRADPAFAALYLHAALEESSDEPAVILAALRRLAEAAPCPKD